MMFLLGFLAAIENRLRTGRRDRVLHESLLKHRSLLEYPCYLVLLWKENGLNNGI
jgi:hypothetical protein